MELKVVWHAKKGHIQAQAHQDAIFVQQEHITILQRDKVLVLLVLTEKHHQQVLQAAPLVLHATADILQDALAMYLHVAPVLVYVTVDV